MTISKTLPVMLPIITPKIMISGQYRARMFVESIIEAAVICPKLNAIAPAELSKIYEVFFDTKCSKIIMETDMMPPVALSTPASIPRVNITNTDLSTISINVCFLLTKKSTYIVTTFARPSRIPGGAKGKGGSMLSKVVSTTEAASISDINAIARISLELFINEKTIRHNV